MENITETWLNESFDKLVSEGVIVYGPHESIKVEDEGYPMEFWICPALATKPDSVGATNPFDGSPPWGNGSDMYRPDERLIITKVNNTHDLALNLFCFDRPQLLMPTLDAYKRQHEALDSDDFEVMLRVLRKLPNMYTIFNGGTKAGCSRAHKHLQALNGPPHAFEHIISSLSDASKKVPFQFFIHKFSHGFKHTPASTVLEVYLAFLAQCRSLVGINEEVKSSRKINEEKTAHNINEKEIPHNIEVEKTPAHNNAEKAPPHNVIMWADRIIVIPRRKGKMEGARREGITPEAAANSAGMLGRVWVAEQEHVDEWSRLGYANVLRELGVPNS